VYVVTQNPLYLDTAEKTAQYVIREMTSPGGGFYSAQDADSEGVEGKYYTFTLTEIIGILGKERGKQFSRAFDITEDGNFEGVNIPNLLRSNDLDTDFDAELQKLYDYRKSRSRLHLDDKVLISWNSMMIAALSVLYRASRDGKYLQAAVNAQIFIEKNLSDGIHLHTSWRDGKASENSFLDDYGFYVAALTELYHSTMDGRYLERAERLCREAVKRFADEKNGGFYLSDADNTELFMNPKESYDGAIPSGNSVMTYNFVRLYQLTEKEEYRELVENQIRYMSAQARDYPTGHGMFLLAKRIYDNPPEHIVIALKNRTDMENITGQLPLLANVITVSESQEYPLINDSTTFYVCKNHTCLAPTNILQT
ncbi:MAG: AGE family epimerase/isomerase, partial [Acetatifactor sp.]|nr:AGE family epimerase/isomerase [Acetatifactor sp.]